jgi:hypothetical protein
MDFRDILSRVEGFEAEWADEQHTSIRRWICVHVGCVPEGYDGPPIFCACTGHCKEWYDIDAVLDGKVMVAKGNGEHLPPSLRRDKPRKERRLP